MKTLPQEIRLISKTQKKYTDRIQDTIKKTQLKDAIRTAHGKINGYDAMVACMDFGFIGGSMGSVVGEKNFKIN
jgi:acetyl-CoA carboxylase carboxyl transferase subunit beta